MEEQRESKHNGMEKSGSDHKMRGSKKILTILLSILAVCIVGCAVVMIIGPKKVYHKLYQMTHSKTSYYAWLETENAKGLINSASKVGENACQFEAEMTFGTLLQLKYSVPEQLTVEGNYTKSDNVWYANIKGAGNLMQEPVNVRIDSKAEEMVIGKAGEYYSIDAREILTFFGERTEQSNYIFTYIKRILLNSGVKVTIDSGSKFTLMDKTVKATKITAVFPKKQLYLSLADQLEKMESDEELLSSMIMDESKKKEMISVLEQTVSMLRKESSSVSEEETTEMICYANANGAILGRVLHIPIGLLDIQISYLLDTSGELIVTADLNQTNVMSIQITSSKADNIVIPDVKEEEIKGDLEYSKLLPFILQQENAVDESTGSPADGEFEFTLGQYKGITVEKETPQVTEDDLKAAIQEFVAYDSKMLPITDKTVVEDGDLVLIDYDGTIDGESFEGSTGSDVELLIGSEQFVDGFEEQLIGAKVSETRTLSITFPEEYENTELAGKKATFKVTVKAIGIREYTDEFVAYNTTYKTKQDYEKSLYEELLAKKTKQCEQDVEDTLMETIIENCTFTSVNQSEIDAYKQQMIDTYQYYASAYQVSLEEFVSSSLQLTMEDFNEAIGYYADLYIKETYVIKEIAKREGIEITEEEYNKQLPSYMEQFECDSVEDFEKAYGGKEAAKEALLQEQVLIFLMQHADIQTESK